MLSIFGLVVCVFREERVEQLTVEKLAMERRAAALDRRRRSGSSQKRTGRGVLFARALHGNK